MQEQAELFLAKNSPPPPGLELLMEDLESLDMRPSRIPSPPPKIKISSGLGTLSFGLPRIPLQLKMKIWSGLGFFFESWVGKNTPSTNILARNMMVGTGVRRLHRCIPHGYRLVYVVYVHVYCLWNVYVHVFSVTIYKLGYSHTRHMFHLQNFPSLVKTPTYSIFTLPDTETDRQMLEISTYPNEICVGVYLFVV